MLDDLYKSTKPDYMKYVLLIKRGMFYSIYNRDAVILNNLLNYNIKELKNGIRVGFPEIAIDKVVNILEENKINYLIIENAEILYKKKYNTNNYDKYSNNDYYINLKKINNITEILKSNIKNKNISSILNEIESILCQIDF